MLDKDGRYVELLRIKRVMICECGGEIEGTGKVYKDASSDATVFKYKHKCTKCKKEMFLNEAYPNFEYIECEESYDSEETPINNERKLFKWKRKSK